MTPKYTGISVISVDEIFLLLLATLRHTLTNYTPHISPL